MTSINEATRFDPNDAISSVDTSYALKTMKNAMQVRVETYVDEGGVEKLRRIRFDSREIEVTENIDQWHGPNYRYFKVKASDGGVYILRHDDARTDWELTMYECAQP